MNKKITLFAAFLAIIFINQNSFSQVGIGTTNPNSNSLLDIDATVSIGGLLLPRLALSNTTNFSPLTANVAGMFVYNTATTGDVTPGLYYNDGSRWISINKRTTVNNGLNYDVAAQMNQLGGTLVENTTVSNGNFQMDFNLNGTGDFNIQDAGVNHFSVTDNGDSTFGSDVHWRDENTTGTILAQLTDDGDDARFRLYENGIVSVDLDTNTQFIFNEQGLDRDFRIESDNNPNAMFVDAGNNAVIFGSTGTLSGNGTLFTPTTGTFTNQTIGYVADFDNGSSRGSTMGLGSIEFLVDGEAELFISDFFAPLTDLDLDLGYGNTWDDVYADDFWSVSDIRAKKDVKPMSYGLNEIMQLSTISYKLKNDPFQDQKIGLIAQEVNKLVKEASKTHNQVKNEKGEFEIVELENIRVSYVSLVPVLIKATQEQQQVITTLEDKISNQEKQIASFESRLKRLEERKN